MLGRFFQEVLILVIPFLFVKAREIHRGSEDSCTDENVCVTEENNRFPSSLHRLEAQNFELVLESSKIKLKFESISQNPPIFTADNFLSPEECDHFIHLAEQQGLLESETMTGKRGKFRILDTDRDKRLSINEMMLTIENAFDIYLEEEDITVLYENFNLDLNQDMYLTPDELNRVKPQQIQAYLQEFVAQSPSKKSRFSQQVWLKPSTSTDLIFKKVQDRVQELMQVPTELIMSSSFQVVRYGPHGHYNAHLDSSQLEEASQCCSEEVKSNCRLCRYATILFYLNDVTEGGETAFPLANNISYDIHKFREEHLVNLQRFCSKANLIVKPEKGKIILWYNHFVDEETGGLGALDELTWHGGCPVLQGEKWVANFWIIASEKASKNIKSEP